MSQLRRDAAPRWVHDPFDDGRHDLVRGAPFPYYPPPLHVSMTLPYPELANGRVHVEVGEGSLGTTRDDGLAGPCADISILLCCRRRNLERHDVTANVPLSSQKEDCHGSDLSREHSNRSGCAQEPVLEGLPRMNLR